MEKKIFFLNRSAQFLPNVDISNFFQLTKKKKRKRKDNMKTQCCFSINILLNVSKNVVGCFFFFWSLQIRKVIHSMH